MSTSAVFGQQRPYTAGTIRPSCRRSSANSTVVELVRQARKVWQEEREKAAHATFEASGEYCRSEKFFEQSQRSASRHRFIGMHAKSQSACDASATKSAVGVSNTYHQQRVPSRRPASALPSSSLSSSSGSRSLIIVDQVDAEILEHQSESLVSSLDMPPSPAKAEVAACPDAPAPTAAMALRRAQVECAAHTRVIETLTMADESGPPIKQVVGLSSFAQLLKDYHHQTLHTISTSATGGVAAHSEGNGGGAPSSAKMFLHRPSTAQPRPASPPPLNCFRPWSAKPMRPYQDPLDVLKRPTSLPHSRGEDAGTVVSTRSYGCTSTLSLASNAKKTDTLSKLLKEQEANDARREESRVAYRATIEALRMRQENLENVLCRIAESRGL